MNGIKKDGSYRLSGFVIALVVALCFTVGCSSGSSSSSSGDSSSAESQTSTHEHEWTAATCTEPETCSICGQTQGEPLGHDVAEWTVTKEATCSETGVQQGVCSRCGQTVEETIPMTDHVLGDWEITKESTVNSSGNVVAGTRVQKCTVCGQTVNTESYKIDVTTAQKNACRKAQDYLDYMAFSYSGLIDQLEYEGYSEEDATFAVDHCGADWNEQAAKKAKDYLDMMGFSRSGLIDQLEYEGFSEDQANFGADSVGL